MNEASTFSNGELGVDERKKIGKKDTLKNDEKVEEQKSVEKRRILEET